jgi:hypothetical protein
MLGENGIAKAFLLFTDITCNFVGKLTSILLQ